MIVSSSSDPRDYWGDAFVPLSKSFLAIALYRLAEGRGAIEDVGDPSAFEMILREADAMFWEQAIEETEFNRVRAELEPYLDKRGKERWKEHLRQRHIKEYGSEP